MAGYKGYSMSNNAVDAYENGEMPLSKWRKADIIKAINQYIEDVEVNFDMDLLLKLPLRILKNELLSQSSWHHTSSMYNKTDFYSLNECYMDELTNQTINELLDKYKTTKTNTKKIKEEIEEKWECEFLVWEGTRKHPKAIEVREEGIIKGNWFYLKDGSKKSINANGFKKIKRID